MTISPGFAGTQLLVDFNQSPETAVMPYPDWNELIYHPQLMEFVIPNEDPDTAGIAESQLTAADNYVSTFAGIKGQVPIAFKKGDKVIATFYNRSDQTLRLQARISFTDDDAPDADYDMYSDWQRPWYTMYAENAGHNDFVGPGQFGQLVFNITDEQSVSAPNALPVEGAHSIVNISMDPRYNAWHGAFVLTRIEISDEADLTPPEKPKGLQAEMTSLTNSDAGATAVKLSWLPATDSGLPGQNSGVNRYAVYRNNEFYAVVEKDWVNFHESNTGRIEYIDAAVISGTEYQYQISAIDGAVTGHYRVPHSNRHFGNESEKAVVDIRVPELNSEQLLLPEKDIRYIGAFRLPRDYDGQNSSWNFASSGLAFYPGGNPERNSDELPGSLYGTGHPHAPQLAEVSIPKPVISNNPHDLRRARRLQDFSESIWPEVYTGGWKPAGGGDPVIGLTWHEEADTSGLFYSIYNSYAMGESKAHGYVSLDLSSATGAWYIGGKENHEGHLAPPLTDRYLFSLPEIWAGTNADNRRLAVGQGYQSGEGIPSYGPTVFAVSPTEKTGELPANNDVMDATTLLRYGTDGSYPDRWLLNWSLTMGFSGAAWLTDGQKSAVVFAVSRPLGDTWYGGEDGTVTFTSDLDLPVTRASREQIRGPMATQREVSLYLYNPADLAAVANDQVQPWEPQPYRIIDVKKHLMAGLSDREPNVGAIAFDADNGFLYMIQSNADTSDGIQGYQRRSMVYVWKVGDVDGYPVEYGSGDGDQQDEAPVPENDGFPGFLLTGSRCHFDVDGNGMIDAETDGYLLYRLMADWDDQSLVADRIAVDATRSTAMALRDWYLQTFFTEQCHLDIDGDGLAFSDTDGFIAYRYMQGLRDWRLTNGVVSANATRTTPEEIVSWLQSMSGAPQRQCHLDIDGDGLMLSETDGYLLYRYIDEYAPQDIIDGRIGDNATRRDAQSVVSFLDSSFQQGTSCHLDVDGDGVVFAGTDGNLLYRFLQGKVGEALTNGATSAAATRTEPDSVRQWMLDTYVE
ncbi:MAG: hypothetical protein ACFHVJ_08705 [Aestuariibacter sp.]